MLFPFRRPLFPVFLILEQLYVIINWHSAKIRKHIFGVQKSIKRVLRDR
nr:MAG TPA: hypothetical protein [Caudoviricetes sp.]